jgi:uncharacterized membrane protein YecN with MAPEG domain
MELQITALTAAALTLLLVVLAVDTIRHRLRSSTSKGLGDDPGLTNASRAHGNLAENAPIALILIALLELGEADRTVLGAVAALFVVGRVFHATGMYSGAKVPLPRSLGIMITLLVQLGLAGWLAARVLG